MNRDIVSLALPVLLFSVVALVSYVAVLTFLRRSRVRQRFHALSTMTDSFAAPGTSPRRWIDFDPARLGVDLKAQRKLRRELIRAGYFSQESVVLHTIARWSLLVVLPLTGVVFLTSIVPQWDASTKTAFAAVLLIIAYYLPSAFISRRQRLLQDKYRVTFPDFLDMLVVCVNAGLSLDAALHRVALELGSENLELRANFDLMEGETRAGKSSIEALKDFADRLGLPEATSLATLLQQSIELGTDVAVSLTTFSDEMRDKRMSRAEEKAAALPPKLTLPLGLFIFPVVLIVILTPVVMRIMRTVG